MRLKAAFQVENEKISKEQIEQYLIYKKYNENPVKKNVVN